MVWRQLLRGPIIDDLVQFEEDFNSRTKKLRWGGGDRLCQTRLIPRSPDGDKNIRFEESLSYSSIVPRQENNIKGAHWLSTSNLLPNEIEKLPLMVSQWSPVLPTWSNLVQFDFHQKHPGPAKDSPLHRESNTKSPHKGWFCIAEGVVNWLSFTN